MRFFIVALIFVFSSTACASPRNQEIEAAFTKVRSGDLSATSGLVNLGPSIVPEIVRFLNDDNEDVRREALILLGVLGGEKACQEMLPALTDKSQDIRERTARYLYGCDRSTLIKKKATACPALIKSLDLGNGSAAAFLLLGHLPSEQTIDTLLKLSASNKFVKLNNWTAPVHASLAASVSLTRLKHNKGKEQLLKSIAANSFEEQVFLFHVISEIDDLSLLRSLVSHLDNKQEIFSYGVPSGASPRPRLCDFAVNSFSGKMNLKHSFQLSSARNYTDSEIEEVKKAVRNWIKLASTRK